MSKEKKRIIFEAISMLANCYPGTVKDERITAYCEMLSDVDLVELKAALKTCLVKYTYFPTLAEIFKLMNPPEPDPRDVANEMAGRIFDAMKEFGFYEPAKAREKLGEIAWFAVESFGGWRAIALVESDNMESARAQLRDMCKMATAVANRKDNPNLLPFQRENSQRLQGTQKIGDTFSAMIEKKD